MRRINFNDIRVKDIKDVEEFYKAYIERLPEDKEQDTELMSPVKQYEIVELDVNGGVPVLIDIDNILSFAGEGQEIFYDYKIAYKVYNLLLDIKDSIEAEKEEYPEIYDEERLNILSQIERLKIEDEELFKQKQEEYEIIINSDFFKDYLAIKSEVEKLKEENKELKGRTVGETGIVLKKEGFFHKFISKFFGNDK